RHSRTEPNPCPSAAGLFVVGRLSARLADRPAQLDDAGELAVGQPVEQTPDLVGGVLLCRAVDQVALAHGEVYIAEEPLGVSAGAVIIPPAADVSADVRPLGVLFVHAGHGAVSASVLPPPSPGHQSRRPAAMRRPRPSALVLGTERPDGAFRSIGLL